MCKNRMNTTNSHSCQKLLRRALEPLHMGQEVGPLLAPIILELTWQVQGISLPLRAHGEAPGNTSFQHEWVASPRRCYETCPSIRALTSRAWPAWGSQSGQFIDALHRELSLAKSGQLLLRRAPVQHSLVLLGPSITETKPQWNHFQKIRFCLQCMQYLGRK